tara:strand:- start:297 stop:758 length:462 start_codon:yes stop_codon:yes gene_type:complete
MTKLDPEKIDPFLYKWCLSDKSDIKSSKKPWRSNMFNFRLNTDSNSGNNGGQQTSDAPNILTELPHAGQKRSNVSKVTEEPPAKQGNNESELYHTGDVWTFVPESETPVSAGSSSHITQFFSHQTKNSPTPSTATINEAPSQLEKMDIDYILS